MNIRLRYSSLSMAIKHVGQNGGEIVNEKIIEKAKKAKSADEILALAKENDIEITPEEARETFELLSSARLERYPMRNWTMCPVADAVLALKEGNAR